jgi:hypothetical protein
MLVAVHTASRVPGRLAPGSNATFLSSLMLNVAASSNFATYSANQMGENVEYNLWSHATHRISVLPQTEMPRRLEREILSLIPTNR